MKVVNKIKLLKQLEDELDNHQWYSEIVDGFEHAMSVVENAPEVNAIPVEWIKNWISLEPLGTNSLIAPEYTIEAMLYWWEKENGKQ